LHDYFYNNPPVGTRIAQLAVAGTPREFPTGATHGGTSD
jgi:hypothetical protein